MAYVQLSYLCQGAEGGGDGGAVGLRWAATGGFKSRQEILREALPLKSPVIRLLTALYLRIRGRRRKRGRAMWKGRRCGGSVAVQTSGSSSAFCSAFCSFMCPEIIYCKTTGAMNDSQSWKKNRGLFFSSSAQTKLQQQLQKKQIQCRQRADKIRWMRFGLV